MPVKKPAKKTPSKATAKKPTKRADARKVQGRQPTARASEKTAKGKTNQPLAVGDKAPAFNLPTDNGNVSLSSLKGKNVVLYFYPKDDTPGCTVEACTFRDHLPKFKKMDAVIIGVSKDSVESHKKFKKKFNLSFPLAADEDGKVCDAYGVIGERSMYGKKFMGLIRSTFLIDGKGVIQAVWRNVKVEGHSEEVQNAIKALAPVRKKAA